MDAINLVQLVTDLKMVTILLYLEVLTQKSAHIIALKGVQKVVANVEKPHGLAGRTNLACHGLGVGHESRRKSMHRDDRKRLGSNGDGYIKNGHSPAKFGTFSILANIYLFRTTQGKSFFDNGSRTAAFKSTWDRLKAKSLREHRFSERSIRNLAGPEDDLDTASKRLGHVDPSTTAKYYRLKPTAVAPLSFH